jgi:alanine dehydrogenase
MLIGVPKEIKNHEYRVGLTPAGVHTLSSMATRCWSKPRRAHA